MRSDDTVGLFLGGFEASRARISCACTVSSHLNNNVLNRYKKIYHLMRYIIILRILRFNQKDLLKKALNQFLYILEKYHIPILKQNFRKNKIRNTICYLYTEL